MQLTMLNKNLYSFSIKYGVAFKFLVFYGGLIQFETATRELGQINKIEKYFVLCK